MALVPRAIRPRLDEVRSDTRIAAILGPRQAGKSTLARTLLDDAGFESYVTLDDGAVYQQAVADPDGFVAGLARPAIVDEIQRAPDLMLAMKQVVDRDTRPGQFVITGSANLLTLRTVADALPGRVEYLRLWPFAQSELRGGSTTLIDRLLAGDPPRLSDQDPGLVAYADIIARGGFPDAHGRDDARRHAYFRSYAQTLLGRDVRDIADAQVDVESVARLLRLLAVRSSEMANFESLSRDLHVSAKTVRAHAAVLEQLFLVSQLRPWSQNLGKREIKTPKIHLTDSGMFCGLVGAAPRRLVDDGALGGKALETFVVNELVRQAGWAEAFVTGTYYYRDRDGREVDLVIEMLDGRILGIEAKAAASIHRPDTLGLRFLRDRLGKRFAGGAVLYTGRATLPLGDRLWAVPLSGLWAAG